MLQAGLPMTCACSCWAELVQPGCQPAALCSTARLVEMAQEPLVELHHKRIADLQRHLQEQSCRVAAWYWAGCLASLLRVLLAVVFGAECVQMQQQPAAVFNNISPTLPRRHLCEFVLC